MHKSNFFKEVMALTKHKTQDNDNKNILHTDFKHHTYSTEKGGNSGFLFSNTNSLLHTHEDFAEFSLITSGEWDNDYDGKKYRLDKNSLIFLGRGTAHTLIPCSQESSHFTFFFKEEYLREMITKFFPDNMNILTTKYKKTTLTPSVSAFLLHEAHKMNGSRSSYNHEMEFQNYIHNLIYFMFFSENVLAETSTKNVHASTLQAYLDNYLYLDEPMTAIYNMFPVSPATLIKQFEAETGQTIAQYRNDKRMEYASLLLKDYKLTIAAVANTVGISTPSHFAREFKKKFGVSPKEFAKRHKTPQ